MPPDCRLPLRRSNGMTSERRKSPWLLTPTALEAASDGNKNRRWINAGGLHRDTATSGFDGASGFDTKRKISAPMATVARHTEGTSMAATADPPPLAAHGIRFCAATPPKFPSIEMAPIPAAARAPDRNREGRDQTHGSR